MQDQPIEKFMNHVLIVVDPQQSLAHAARLMRGHGIRHLPVVEKGRIVGILSQRDMYLLESFSDTAPEEIRVEEAMTHEPFLVDPEETVYSVASRMAARKIGSAVVARDGQLLGLFTVTDALRALAIFAHPQREALEVPVLEDES